MSNWLTKEFTTEEVAQLDAAGWILSNYRATDGGWVGIIKRADNLFEVQRYMDDPDANGGWWETDSEWNSLAEALENT